MLLMFIATLSLGLAIAGLVIAAFRLTGSKAPKWTLPAAAGLGMILFQVWNGYTWFSRTAGKLPPRISVVQTFTGTSVLEPWTYLVPRVERFSAVDTGSIRGNESAPSLAMADVHLVGRYAPTITTTQIFDCASPRRADLTGSLSFDAVGRPVDARWLEVHETDPMRRIICKERERS